MRRVVRSSGVENFQLKLRILELLAEVQFPLCVQPRGHPTVINPEDDVCFDLRTSCTEEEAVAKLLGWMKGARRIPNLVVTLEGINPTQFTHIYSLPEPLDKLITQERDSASINFNNSVTEGDIDAAMAWESQVNYWDDIANRALRYRLAIQTEFSRPKPKLQIDEDKTNETGVRHIKLTSLDIWARISFGIEITGQEESDNPDRTTATSYRQRTKGQQQEAAILEALKQLGFDSLNIPLNPPGKGGPKALVRQNLNIPSSLFGSDKVFEKAWERLRKQGDIVDLPRVSPQIVVRGTLAGEDS